MPQNVYNIIRDAIQNKKQVVATYQGYVREMCPHVLGSKNGQIQALFFQFAGGSSSGLPPGGSWRCIPLDGLSNVSSRVGPWHTGSSHTQEQTCVDNIAIEVVF